MHRYGKQSAPERHFKTTSPLSIVSILLKIVKRFYLLILYTAVL